MHERGDRPGGAAAARYRLMLDRLFGPARPSVVVSPARVERVLAALGRPHQRLGPVVHIAGTNGKGSTAAFVEAAARACGLRTGLFTSPHLVRVAERFVVDGQPLDALALLEAYERTVAALHRVDPAAQLTFFETLTIMGLQLFADADLQLLVLEVGVGGQRDATNVVSAGFACVTGVAMDHQAMLGADLGAITTAKAGIFKPGQRAVIGRSGLPEAVPLLEAAARRVGVAALTLVEAPVPADMRLGLAGAHQRDNAAAALAVIDHLVAAGVVPDLPQRHLEGLACVRHPGRIECVAQAPRVILDGAHNPHGATALAAEMANWARPRVLVLGVSADKDAHGIAAMLGGQAEHTVVTAAADARAMPAAELAAIVRAAAPGGAVSIEARVGPAVTRARALAGVEGTVVVAGSLFVIGEAKLSLAR